MSSYINSKSIEVTQRKSAIIAGVSLLVMAIAAAFSFGYIHNTLIIPGDAAKTTESILNSEMLFRNGILGWIIILICDIIVAWALYIFLAKVNEKLALLTAWLRLIYTAMLGFAICNLVIVLLLLNQSGFVPVFEEEQLQVQVLLFLNVFEGIWSLGLIIFGLHLLLLGYLVYQSGFIPKILGILLVIAAISYLFISFFKLSLPYYVNFILTAEAILSIPMAIGELAFGIWLLIKGGKAKTTALQPSTQTI